MYPPFTLLWRLIYYIYSVSSDTAGEGFSDDITALTSSSVAAVTESVIHTALLSVQGDQGRPVNGNWNASHAEEPGFISCRWLW